MSPIYLGNQCGSLVLFSFDKPLVHFNLKLSLGHLPDPLWYVDLCPHHLLVLLYELVRIIPLSDLPLIFLLHHSHLGAHPLNLGSKALLLQRSCLKRVVSEHLQVVLLLD